MIEFKAPKPEDAKWAIDILQSSGRMGSESCFGNVYMWCCSYACNIANVDGTLICKAGDSYTVPTGGDCKTVFDELIKEYREQGLTLKLHGISDSMKEDIEKEYPELFTFTEDRDSFDYIYSVEALAALSGKKYHGKRNHISFFENNFDWSYEDMTAANAAECLEFSEYWLKSNKDKRETGTDREMQAISRGLKNFEILGMRGGILRVQGDIVAYTFGEAVNSSLFCTHVEKAVSDIRGAYPMINREFARNTISDFTLVNREEDMGIEGLRRAKESYHPEILLRKYIAVMKG